MLVYDKQQTEDAIEAARMDIGQTHCDIRLVGSLYVLGMGHDMDLLVLSVNMHAARSRLLTLGWASDIETLGADARFTSLKKGTTNIILTEDDGYYHGFIRAADACKFLKVTSKEDRIILHRIIRDGKDIAEAANGEYTKS